MFRSVTGSKETSGNTKYDIYIYCQAKTYEKARTSTYFFTVNNAGYSVFLCALIHPKAN